MQNNILVKSLIFGIITVLIGAVLIQTTTGDNPPTAPSSLVATTYSPTQINITWSDNSNNEDGFEIQYSTDSASFALLDTVGAGSTTYAHTTPSLNQPYHYRVLAYNTGGDSDYSNTATAIIPVFQEGITFTSWGENDYLSQQSEGSLINLSYSGAEYIALLTTWYQTDLSSTDILPQTNTPSDAALQEAINDAHALGLEVMLKPHLDVSDGSWRGTINYGSNEVTWAEWFTNYTTFIEYYAQRAELWDADMFCLGVELKGTTTTGVDRTKDWENVTAAVRAEYSGPIIYAANHDEYLNVEFWDKLDYIGIDAYFSLTGSTTPTVQQLKQAWIDNGDLSDISNFHTTWNKPIIFSEIGYQDVDGTNIEPWWRDPTTYPNDQQEQADCLQAVLETFWDEEWFYGIYWWDWYFDITPGNDPDRFGLYDSMGQPKLALDILKSYYDILPTADFTYSPSFPTDLDVVQFTDTSLDPDGAVVSWLMEFGDHYYSSLQNPVHCYYVEGIYNVTLTIEDDDGAKDNITKTITVIPDDGYITDLINEWNLIGIPYDESINKTDIIVNYNVTDYSWENATTGNNEEGEPLILSFIYNWNTTNQNYDVINVLYPNTGYWMYAYYNCTLF